MRVRRPETIAQPRLRALLMRAVEAVRYPGTTPRAFYDEIAAGITGDRLGVFVGVDEHKGAEAVAVVMLPQNQAMMTAQMTLVYSESRLLSRMLGDRVREFVRRAGYDRIIGVNLLHDDETYCRAFRHVGETSVIGSLIEARI
jgi:hypothetical protein